MKSQSSSKKIRSWKVCCADTHDISVAWNGLEWGFVVLLEINRGGGRMDRGKKK